MIPELESLEPKLLWKQFAALSAIPRGSKNEKAVAEYVVSEANRLGLETKRDNIGNVFVFKKAHLGMHRFHTCILQGHLDMVCEKNEDTVHDFLTDPIRLRVEGDILRATGTTLGADNGIGVAAALAFMESTDIPHGPLEFLFTIDEETGLTGAFNLGQGILKGRRLLNLDSEEDDSIYVGCAGGLDTQVTFPFQPVKSTSWREPYRLKVSGLRGGHSGLNVADGLGNAIKILARALAVMRKNFAVRVASIDGGSKRNAIPREAFAGVLIQKADFEAISAQLNSLKDSIGAELGKVEPGLAISLEPLAEAPAFVLPNCVVDKVCDFIYAARPGVISMSPDIPNLVQTSSNLAIITTGETAISISLNHRSSVETAKYDVADSVTALARLSGADVEHGNGYPGWKPDLESRLLALASSTYRQLFGENPNIKAIHAGLECGIIGEKYAGMEMISFGPHIRGAHSPEENLSISSTQKFWKFLCGILSSMNE